MPDQSKKQQAAAYFDLHQDLSFILSKVKTMLALNQRIRTYLDPAFRDQCETANLSNQRLTLIVPNGSIATTLKYQVPDLLIAWKSDSELCDIRQIEIKVRPPFLPGERLAPPTPPLAMPLLTTQTAQTMRQIARSLKDTQLREVMIRIASHVKEK